MSFGQIQDMLQAAAVLLSLALNTPTTIEDKIHAIQNAREKIETAQSWAKTAIEASKSPNKTKFYTPKCHLDSVYARVECNPLVHPSTTTVENNGEFGQIPPM